MGVTALLAVWAAWAWTDLRSARTSAIAAIADAEQAAGLVRAGDLDGAAAALQRSRDRLADAGDRLLSPALLPVRWTPLAATEISAARAGVDAADATAAAGLGLIEYLNAERPPLLADGRLNRAGLVELAAVLETAHGHAVEARRRVEEAPGARTAAVRRRLDRIDDTSAALVDGLEAASAVTDRLIDAVEGTEPYRLLVLFENGAELRATGGLMGVAALIEVGTNGIRLSRAEVVHDLRTRDAAGGYVAVDAPPDYVDRYGEFEANTTLWLNVNLSPHFPTVAGVASRLYETATEIEPDAVVRADLVAIGYLLEPFSPIAVDGEPFAAGTLATDFMIDSYRRFDDPNDQSAYLAGVVRQLFDQLLGPAAADRSRLIAALERALSERRLAGYAGTDEIDGALRRIGADGALLPGEPGDVEVVVQNFAANKIDLFTETALRFDTETNGCRVETTTAIALTNRTPADMTFLPVGNIGDRGLWWVSLHLPRDARVLELSIDDQPAGGSLGEEAGRPVVSLLVGADPGDTVTAAVRWSHVADGDEYRFRLGPQPHIRTATVTFDGGPVRPAATEVTHTIPVDC